MMKPIFFLVFYLSTLSAEYSPRAQSWNIGAILDPMLEYQHAFDVAVEFASSNGNFSHLAVKTVDSGNILDTEKEVCETILMSGVGAVFGPNHLLTCEHVQAIFDMLDVPHFLTAPFPKQSKQMSLINLYPDQKLISKAFADLIVLKGWQNFTIIYEDPDGLSQVLDILHLHTSSKYYGIKVRQLLPGINFRPLLINVKKSGMVNYLIQCDADTLPELLAQAQQVGIMSNNHSYIITSLDFNTIDLERFSYGGANISGLRMYSPADDDVQQFAKNLDSSIKEVGQDDSNLDISVEKLKLSTLLIYDAVQVLSTGLNSMYDMIANNHGLFYPFNALYCDGGLPYAHGSTIINQIRMISTDGLTGPISFDSEGLRTDIYLELIELTNGGELLKVGNWTSSMGYMINRTDTEVDEVVRSDSMKNLTFTVYIKMSAPYQMTKQSTDKLKGNEQYEGFGIELIYELAKLLEFNVEFKVTEEPTGKCFKNRTCTGMLKHITEEPKSFAITDLTITADRIDGVDFTEPFLSLGISILYKKAEEQAPGLFTFLLPFSTGVWLCLGAAYLLVSILLYLLGRICPEEWQNPYPCIEEPEVLMNQFTFANALWFNAGAMLLQGSEIAPIAYGTRTVASMWWFFVLIITSSYTANLTASLAVRPKTVDFNNVVELANNNKDIAYGALRGGSTLSFFQESSNEIYRKMYEEMEKHPENIVANNDEGVAKVLQGDYAYLMESTSIEYMKERYCNTTQVGSLLDSKGYGIAMMKGSPYRSQMSQAVLKLQESGAIDSMKKTWWKEKRTGNCGAASADEDSDKLSLSSVGGVFVILAFGMLLGIVISLIDCLKAAKRRSKTHEVPLKKELKKELGIVFSLSTNEKPVQHQATPQSDSISLRSMDSNHNGEENDNVAEFNTTRSPRQSLRSGSRRRSSLHHPIHDGNVRLARQFTQ